MFTKRDKDAIPCGDKTPEEKDGNQSIERGSNARDIFHICDFKLWSKTLFDPIIIF
jgi:hypothetical protein